MYANKKDALPHACKATLYFFTVAYPLQKNRAPDRLQRPLSIGSLAYTNSETTFPLFTSIKPRSVIFSAGLTGSECVLMDMIGL